jgi:hypothetical protein
VQLTRVAGGKALDLGTSGILEQEVGLAGEHVVYGCIVVAGYAVDDLVRVAGRSRRSRPDVEVSISHHREQVARLVEPSMSVNRKLTVPAGSSAMAHTRMVRRGEGRYEQRQAQR